MVGVDAAGVSIEHDSSSVRRPAGLVEAQDGGVRYSLLRGLQDLRQDREGQVRGQAGRSGRGKGGQGRAMQGRSGQGMWSCQSSGGQVSRKKCFIKHSGSNLVPDEDTFASEHPHMMRKSESQHTCANCAITLNTNTHNQFQHSVKHINSHHQTHLLHPLTTFQISRPPPPHLPPPPPDSPVSPQPPGR